MKLETRSRDEINRANARQSTGPADTSSTRYNAVKHGLLAEGITELDDPTSFPNFASSIATELKPVGEIERFLARRIALTMTRLNRVARLEAEFTTAHLNPPIVKKEGSFHEAVEAIERVTVVDPGLPARISADAVEALANRFQRYETSLENKFYRALGELERLQRMRAGEHVPPPAAMGLTIHAERPLASFGNDGAELHETML